MKERKVNNMTEESVRIERKNSIKGIAYVVVSAIFYSLGGVLIKEVPWNPIAINGSRCLLAGLTMLMYMKMVGHKFVINKTVMFVGVCNFAMNLTFVIATKMTSAANAIVLQFTEPIFVIILMWIIFGKRPKRKAVITCIVVFGGIMCFFMDKITTDGMIGNLLAIFSGITYAVVFMTKSFKGGDFESSLVVAMCISVVAGIPSVMQETEFSLKILLCIIGLGVVQLTIGSIFLSKGLDFVSPVTASLTSTIEPILNPILVAIFCGETIGPLSILGAALVISACTCYNVLEAMKK